VPGEHSATSAFHAAKAEGKVAEELKQLGKQQLEQQLE
jgi:hypothetical protein